MSCEQPGLLIVGLAGVAGIGKSASARLVEALVNEEAGRVDYCKALGMDGFHLYRSQLDDAEDPCMMHRRRGAPFTFAPHLLLDKLLEIKAGHSTKFPTFSHSEKDPVQDAIEVEPLVSRVIVLEGLYLLCEIPVWKDIRGTLDYRVFIRGDLDSSMQRVIRRNSQALGLSIEATEQLVLQNDRLNAEIVMESIQFADEVVDFVEKSPEQLSSIWAQ